MRIRYIHTSNLVSPIFISVWSAETFVELASCAGKGHDTKQAVSNGGPIECFVMDSGRKQGKFVEVANYDSLRAEGKEISGFISAHASYLTTLFDFGSVQNVKL